MRVLTVQQPWAWAIVAGVKPVENRTTAWKYRGPLAIHAGTRLSERGCDAVPELIDETNPAMIGAYSEATLAYGAVLGVVDLVDLHHAEPGCCESPWAEQSYAQADGAIRTAITHLLLDRPRALADPIPAAGRLGLWNPDDDLRDEITRALTTGARRG